MSVKVGFLVMEMKNGDEFHACYFCIRLIQVDLTYVYNEMKFLNYLRNFVRNFYLCLFTLV